MLDFCAWCNKHITPVMFNKVFSGRIRSKGILVLLSSLLHRMASPFLCKKADV